MKRQQNKRSKLTSCNPLQKHSKKTSTRKPLTCAARVHSIISFVVNVKAIKHSSTKDLLRCKVAALIGMSRFPAALKFIQASKCASEMSAEHVYCLYKLNRYKDALEVIKNNNSGDILMYLEAQISYKLNDYARAQECYQTLLRECQYPKDSEEYQELVTNYLAACTGSAYQGVDCDQVDVSVFTKSSPAYEIFYNAGCLLASQCRYSDALVQLEKAKKLCRESMLEDGYEESAVNAELLSISVQMAYCHQKVYKKDLAIITYEKSISSSDSAVVCVAVNNLVSLNQGTADIRKKCDSFVNNSSLLSRLCGYQVEGLALNRGTVLLQQNKVGKARAVANAVLQHNHSSKTASVLLAAANLQERKLKFGDQESFEVLDTLKAKYPKSSFMSLLLAQHYVSVAAKDKAKSELQKIKTSVPYSLRSVYHWLCSSVDMVPSVESQGLAAAQIDLTSKQSVNKAVEKLGSLLIQDPSDAVVLALLSKSYTQIDPASAAQYMSQLTQLSSKMFKGSLKGASEDVSQFQVSRIAAVGIVKPSQVAVKKSRKRKHKNPVPKNFDPNAKPDPERWIPKKMRAAYLKKMRRKMKDQPSRGPQGAVEEAPVVVVVAPVKPAPVAASSRNTTQAPKKGKKKGGKSKW